MDNRIGKKIAEIRNSQKLTQKQLAKKLGVAENFIKDVELGKKIMNESLIDKVSKLYNVDFQQGLGDDDTDEVDKKKFRESPQKALEKANDVWTNAFGSLIKKVPVYDYSMTKALASIDMPVVDNKVEGYGQDKVMFLKVEEDSMLSMRIHCDDLAFSLINSNIENNGIYFIERGDERIIRQIKVLDSEKLLLVSHKGALRTETVNKKEIKVLAKLLWLKIKL